MKRALTNGLIASFTRIAKYKNYMIKSIFVGPEGWWTGPIKPVLIIWFLFNYSWKIVCNTIQSLIIQQGLELVLIQRILIGFEAILKTIFLNLSLLFLIWMQCYDVVVCVCFECCDIWNDFSDDGWLQTPAHTSIQTISRHNTL